MHCYYKQKVYKTPTSKNAINNTGLNALQDNPPKWCSFFFFLKPKFQMICFVQYLVYHRWNIVVVKVRGDYAANVLRTTRVA